MKKLILIVIAVLALAPTLFAQSGRAGNTGFAFLKIGVGGRGAALGNSHVADVTGAEAAYWNPAHLASSENEIYFSHSEWLLDVNNDFVAVKFNGLGAAWALSLQLQNVGGIQQRSKASAEPIGEITAHNIAFGLSYARKVNHDFDFGITLKYIGERIINHATNGFAIDFGAKYRLAIIEGLSIAGSIHNIGSVEKLRTEKITLPTFLRAGLMYQPDFLFGANTIKLFAGYENVFKGEAGVGTGIEFLANNIAAFRAGYRFGNESQTISGGIGLVRKSYRFDYAYAPFGLDLGNTHRISLAIGL